MVAMSDKKPSLDWVPIFVEVSIAILAWVFPDIPTSLKVLICLILVGILILSRTGKPESWTLSNIQYIGITLSSILVGIVECTLFGCFFMYVGHAAIDRSIIYRLVQVGFTYGLIVGFPVQAIIYFRSSIEFGRSSFVVFLILLLSWLLFSQVIRGIVLSFDKASDFMQTMYQTTFLALSGPSFPLVLGIWKVFGLEDAPGTLWGNLSTLSIVILTFLQNLQFEMIGRTITRNGRGTYQSGV
jgi:hypothetical protein